jgi:hypothetical protein
VDVIMGCGDSAPAAPVDVYVAAYVDRILKVDDRDYESIVGSTVVGGTGEVAWG